MVTSYQADIILDIRESAICLQAAYENLCEDGKNKQYLLTVKEWFDILDKQKQDAEVHGVQPWQVTGMLEHYLSKPLMMDVIQLWAKS